MYSYTSPAKLAAILFAALFAFGGYAGSAAAFTCASGAESHTATAAEAASVPSGNIVAGLTQVCPEDLKLGISADAGSAKAYLLSIARGLPGTKAPPDKAHVDNLNNTFAVCAANFLKAYSQRYGSVTLSSAFRCGPNSPATISCNRSENTAAGGATHSNHQLGLAIDVSPSNGNFQSIWNFAKANPQFGVCFPYLSSDRPHMALAGTGTGEARRCAAQGVTSVCSGAPTFDVKSIPASMQNIYSGDESPASLSGCVVSTTPLIVTSCSSAAQVPKTLPSPSISSTPITTSATPAATTATQPQICSPSFSCTGNIMYYKTTSCTEQVYQTCPYGCGENSCNLSTSTSATVGTGVSGVFSTSTNTNTNDNSSEATSSVSDILNSYLNPTAVEIGTSTSLAFRLNPETGDIEQIPVITNTGSLSPASGVISSIQPVAGQQTFTSNDLSGSGGYFSSQQQASSFQKVLEGMKSALLWAINALRSL